MIAGQRGSSLNQGESPSSSVQRLPPYTPAYDTSEYRPAASPSPAQEPTTSATSENIHTSSSHAESHLLDQQLSDPCSEMLPEVHGFPVPDPGSHQAFQPIPDPA